MLKFSRALVTGGAGFIGSHLVDRLVTAGVEVVVLDDFSSGNLQNLSEAQGSRLLTIVDGDVCDPRAVSKAVEGADVVFHEAALVSLQQCADNPKEAERVNVEGTHNLLKQAAGAGVREFVLASSAAVYGVAVDGPVSERTKPKPSSVYGRTKLAAERLCLGYRGRSSMETTILRYFNVYGPRSGGGPYAGVISSFADSLLADQSLTIYGDGSQTRDFVYVGDVAEANMLAAKRGLSGTYNVATGSSVSITELAETLTKLVKGESAPIRSRRLPPRKDDVRYSQADVTLAEKKLDFRPAISLRKGLGEYLAWRKALVGQGSSSHFKS